LLQFGLSLQAEDDTAEIMLVAVPAEDGFPLLVKRLRAGILEVQLLVVSQHIYLGLYLINSGQDVSQIVMRLGRLGDLADLGAEVGDVPVDGPDLGLDLDLDVVEDVDDLVLDDLADEFLLPEDVGVGEGGACAVEFAGHGWLI